MDENGRPLVVYHGTPEGGFNSFSNDTKGKRTNHSSEDVGFHFTDDKKYASAYSLEYRKVAYPILMETLGYIPEASKAPDKAMTYNVYLSLQRPMYIDYSNAINKSIIDNAINNDYDGIIGKIGETVEYVVFSPNQIKSATGNNGSFSPESNDIRFRVEQTIEDLNKINSLPRTERNEGSLDNMLSKAAEQYREKKRTKRNFSEVKEKVREFIQDHDLPIRRLEELVRDGGGVIKDNMKPYRDMSNSYGRNETLYKDFSKNKMEPIIKTISKIIKSGVNGIEILPYMISKHAIERNAYMRANIVTGKQIGRAHV